MTLRVLGFPVSGFGENRWAEWFRWFGNGMCWKRENDDEVEREWAWRTMVGRGSSVLG